MKLGVSLTTSFPRSLDARALARDLIERAAAIRAAGLDSLFVGDHHATPGHYFQNVPKEALSFLSGFGKLTKEFKVTDSSAFGNSPEGTALHLVPRSKSPQYEWLDARFGADHLLAELIVKNLSGNVSHYNFKDIRTNSGLSDRIFTLSTGKATPDTLPQ